MAALNFPNNPNVNDRFPSPSIAGIPTWRWDGTKWVPLGGNGGGPQTGDVRFTSGKLEQWDGSAWQEVPVNPSNTTGTGDTFVLQQGPTINQPKVMGVTDGSNAAPGEIGELQLTTILFNFGYGIYTSISPQSLNLSPGDWNVSAYIYSTNTQIILTALGDPIEPNIIQLALLGGTPGAFAYATTSLYPVVPGSSIFTWTLPIGPIPYLTATNISITLEVIFTRQSSGFSMAGISIQGHLLARRVR